MTGVTAPVGWRRGRCWDDFKDRVTSAAISAFLDDPMLPVIGPGDLKKLRCVSDCGSTQARYNNPQFVENQFRAVADNEWDVNSEPANDTSTTVDAGAFWKMMEKPFGGQSKTHVFAVLKRAVTCVQGKNGQHLGIAVKSVATVGAVCIQCI